MASELLALPLEVRFLILSYVPHSDILKLASGRIPILSLECAVYSRHYVNKFLARRTLPSLYCFGNRYPFLRKKIYKIVKEDKPNSHFMILIKRVLSTTSTSVGEKFLLEKCLNAFSMNDISNNLTLAWNWDNISHNIQNYGEKAIIEYPTIPWNFNILSTRVSKEFIQNHPELPWNLQLVTQTAAPPVPVASMSLTPSGNLISISFFTDHSLRDFCHHFKISIKSWDELTVEMGKAHPEINDDLIRLSEVPIEGIRIAVGAIFSQIPLHIIEGLSDWCWPFALLSMNKNLTLQFLRNHRDKNWDWSKVPINKALSEADILSSLEEFPFKFTEISYRNPSLDFLTKIGNKITDWHGISRLSYLTTDFILSFKDKPFDWAHLNANINIDFFLTHSDLPRCPELAANPFLTKQIILDHPEIPWNYKTILERMDYFNWDLDELLPLIIDYCKDMKYFTANFNPDIELYPWIKWNKITLLFNIFSRNEKVEQIANEQEINNLPNLMFSNIDPNRSGIYHSDNKKSYEKLRDKILTEFC